MRKLYAIISFAWLCTGATHRATAQNLVLNPSFETVNVSNLKCSWYLDNSEFLPAISNWDMPTGGSTDIFHTSLATSCFCSPYSTDPSSVGSQTPRTGSSMTALFTYGSGGCTPYREYVQGQLSSSLVVGTTYRIEMYVSLADNSNRAANNIGVKFLSSRYSSSSMCVWSAVPDVNYTSTPITDKTNWTRISFCYTPTVANLQYFAIGNFYNDGATTSTSVGGAQATTRYYLDDVSIVASSSGAATASASGMITCANNSVNLSTNVSGASYTWVAPAGSSITSGVNSQSATGQGGGNYTVTINDPNSCGSALSTAVVNVAMNTTPPPASASSGGALTCASTNVTLSGSSSGGMNYNWSGPGIVSGGSSANPVVNQPGTYNLTVTNPSNGCSANSSVLVSQNTTPPGASASAAGAITCTATSISLSATTTSGTSYSWSGPGIVSGGNTANPNVNQPGTYNLVVTGANGCTSAAAVNVTQNTTLPNAAASSGSTVTCISNAVSLSASPAGLSYTWSASAGSSITGGTNSQAATANGPGPYAVMVYNPSNGCSALVNVSPTINNAPPAATASAGSGGFLTCTTANLTLSGAPSGGMTYSWSGPGIVSGGSTANPVVNQPGTYNLTVTNPANGCSANASTSISQNTVNPTASIGPSSYTTTCTSPGVQFAVTSSTATVSYSWQVPSTGSLNNSSISNPIASGTGVFTVVVTNTATGCSSTAAFSQVFADAAAPAVSLSTNSLVLTCATTTLGATATATGSNLTYNWSPSPSSGGNTSTPVFNVPGSYSVVVTNTVNGCSTGANLIVASNTISPSVGAISTQTLTCATTTAALTATSSAASSSYSWMGTGISGPSNTATVVVNQAGTYSVVITDNVNGCSSSMVFGSVMSDFAPPTATLSAVSNSIITCTSPTVMLSVASTPTSNVSYSWSIGGSTPAATIANPGVITVTVTNMLNGCTATAQYHVIGNVAAPSVVAAFGTMSCTTNTVALLAISGNPNVTYAWTGPWATSIVSGAYTASPVCTSVGIYTVVVTDPITSCSTTQTVSVVHGTVTAAFDADPTSGISPLSVNFTNQSAGATAYSWSFGNGNGSSAVDPNQVFTGSQTYTVMLIATAGPCADTAYATIVVDDDLGIEIPNVFTPNADGINDVFYIKSTGVKEMELEIFNRWGQKLYTFAGSKASWDGMTGQGQVVPDGTYFFFVRATGFNGTVIEKQGTLNLFK